ncbi:uncharacterized protein PV09_00429 [Verruconis gallopava]|uniref:Phytanoyl-CoA dioxygenase n=1 Tax=Verruconis gallopava TaxID=253628 RepID=A0A0D1Y3R0_9PEZI|nr:uncharacterized protein PV09_00429 [Verruconis gallopava]KIW09556.1 hypothetical protein PV09_00429 [Verruconis gallopava]
MSATATTTKALFPAAVNSEEGQAPPRSTSVASLNLREKLERDGFVLIPSLIKAPQLTSLRNACRHSTELARSGKWPFIRTLPKQFPPWPSDPSHGIWGVQHLLHPSMPGSHEFAESYFGDAIVEPIKEILGCKDEDLIMELYNLLVRPDEDFALRWHRDDISAEATAEEEMQRLREPSWHAQWNLALYDDRSLIVVPGSHRRARTDAERKADPLTKFMPGQQVVAMKAGDVVFYNNNILHRGVYDSKIERMTLHGSVGHVKGSSHRARNVLQHGVGEWVDKVDFDGLSERTRQRAESMRARLVTLGRESGDVGYAHPD